MKPADELRKWGAATAAAKARRESIAALLDECERVLALICSTDYGQKEIGLLSHGIGTAPPNAVWLDARATLARLRGER